MKLTNVATPAKSGAAWYLATSDFVATRHFFGGDVLNADDAMSSCPSSPFAGPRSTVNADRSPLTG
jgi:hypothetical protein